MFSRTTMASSISRPMHSDSAISVRKLSEKPNAYSAMKVAITEQRQREPGDDRAAPAVQEQEHDQHREAGAFEDRALHAVDALLDALAGVVDDRELDVLRDALPAAPRRRRSTPRPVSTMLASCAFCTSIVIDALAVDARERGLLLLAVDHVGDLRQVDGTAALLRDDDPAELRRVLDLALDAHDRVALRRATGGRPARPGWPCGSRSSPGRGRCRARSARSA